MKIKIYKKPSNIINGTSLQDVIYIAYSELVRLFGQPLKGDGYKVDAQWILEIEDIVVTIYNYKDGKNYLGSAGKPTSKITEWYVGGFSGTSPILLEEYLEEQN